jgi:hypothetical protein
MKFAGICLITNDVLALAGFYQQVLGLGGDGDAVHMAFPLEGGDLAIFSTDGLEGKAALQGFLTAHWNDRLAGWARLEAPILWMSS